MMLSVSLFAMLCIVGKRYILQQKCLKIVNGNCPPRSTIFTILQLSTPYAALTSANPQTFHPQNFTCLLYFAFLITWLFHLFCYEHAEYCHQVNE